MYTHIYKKRVRYGETDQMGYLYYGHYPLYYEIGRVEALRDLGIIYKSLEEKHGIILPVLEVQSKYLKPAFYDDEIEIHTHIKELPSVRITFDYEFYNHKHEKIHSALVKLCFVDSKKNRPIRTPQFITDLLKPYFG